MGSLALRAVRRPDRGASATVSTIGGPGGAEGARAARSRSVKDNRFNDGRTDRQGRFWVGSLHREETEPTGAFTGWIGDGNCSRIADDIYASNGTAFSPDGRTGYHADSRQRLVWRFDCRPRHRGARRSPRLHRA